MTAADAQEQPENSFRRETSAVLDTTDYLSLRTRRKNGEAVDCPVWFARSTDALTIWIRSKRETPKVKRLIANPTVTLMVCNWKGVTSLKAQQVLHGDARLVDERDPEWITAEAALADRYGWKWNSIPLFRLPMTGTIKTDMSFPRKIQHMRSGRALPDSCLIAVDLSS